MARRSDYYRGFRLTAEVPVLVGAKPGGYSGVRVHTGDLADLGRIDYENTLRRHRKRHTPNTAVKRAMVQAWTAEAERRQREYAAASRALAVNAEGWDTDQRT